MKCNVIHILDWNAFGTVFTTVTDFKSELKWKCKRNKPFSIGTWISYYVNLQSFVIFQFKIFEHTLIISSYSPPWKKNCLSHAYSYLIKSKMGKDNLIDAARLGNYPACEKILSSKPKRPGAFAR